MSLKVKKLKLANACMQISKHMAELNILLHEPEVQKLWYKCPVTDEIGLSHFVTKSHEFHMISQWLNKHTIGE